MFTRFHMLISKVLILWRKAICSLEKGRNRLWLLCQRGIGIIPWSAASFRLTFVGRTKDGWCWNFIFTMFGFRAKFEPQFWWYGWYLTPRHFCHPQEHYYPKEHSFPLKNSLNKTGRGLQLETRRNDFTEAIKKFTQHLWCFQ